MHAWWLLANGTAPNPPVNLMQWRGAITFLVDDMEFTPGGGADRRTVFTAQGYDSVFSDADRQRCRVQYRRELYTHWPMGPLLQASYHGRWPSTDFRGGPDWWEGADYRGTPQMFLERAQELQRDGIVTPFFLLDDQGVYAAEHGGVNRDKIERELTPLFSRRDFQETFPIVVEAWEPQWKARDHEWVAAWMARVWPNAIRVLHLPSGKGAPGRQEDLKEKGGEFEHESDIWNLVIRHYHLYGIQETHVLEGAVQDGRTREQQFVYDLLDADRRFRYGSGSNAPTSGPAVDQWNSVRGTSDKDYNEWNGNYHTVSASGGPLVVCAYEYASFLIKQNANLYPGTKVWGDLALTVEGVIGYGDGGFQTP